MINHKEPPKQKFLFSKCRPKTGNSNLNKIEKATLFENTQVLESFSNKFFESANDQFNIIFSDKKDSKWSYIYENYCLHFSKS